MDISQIDVFTTEPLTGNPAGIIREASDLTEKQMQAIARELAVSETAFLLPSEVADYRIRYFTPTTEVELCGHATIGAMALLYKKDHISTGTYSLDTIGGQIEVSVEDNGTVWMEQEPPEVTPVDVSYERIASVLNMKEIALTEMDTDLQPAIASTGLPFLILPVTYLDQLGNANPDDEAVEELCEEYDAKGIYAFTFDTLEADSTLHGRCFVSPVGITEDPVTGTASGACGGYLEEMDVFDTFPETLKFEQGHFIDRPGIVQVRVDSTVSVGGKAIQVIDGSMSIPETTTEDIIEPS
ncbi:MAG: PhzF family phenazine biosynthesis protein [Halobacteriaceae archaeon]